MPSSEYRIASAIWRGFEGTAAQLAFELGMGVTKVRRTLRLLFQQEDWVKRQRDGRSFVYFMGKRSAR